MGWKEIRSIILLKPKSFFRISAYGEGAKVYARHGKKAIVLARFVPVVRTFAPILAGTALMAIGLSWHTTRLV